MARKIVSISGLIGSGKDTAAQYLIDNYDFTKFSFASTLKDAVAVVFSWDRALLEGATLESRKWREEVDLWWAEKLNMPHLTPRWVLQHWGTQLFRLHFHDDIWVASLENKLRQQSGNIVITDSRFINEFDTVKQLGGTTIRVLRGIDPEWCAAAVLYNKTKDSNYLEILKSNNVHASEYSSVGLDYDIFLDNNSELKDLYNKLDLLMINLESNLPFSK